jgi:deazaflavin-dependent oxidoreductase (nitroreductase family)
MARLRYVDPHAPRSPIYRAFVRILGTPLMTRLSRTAAWSSVMWRIDPYLMRLTRGHIGTGLIVPTALLQTRGSRTGRVRRNAVIYFHDGERVTIIASQAGRPDNPAWFHNVRAHPDVMLGGEPFRAQIVDDEDTRARLWELAERIFPAFAAYRDSAARAGRTIPILQLVPR